MEFFLELVGELLLEGCLAVGSNKKNSKWVRYPLLAVDCGILALLIHAFRKRQAQNKK